MTNNEYLEMNKEELIKIINTQSMIIAKLKGKNLGLESTLRNITTQLTYIKDKILFLQEHHNTHKKGL